MGIICSDGYFSLSKKKVLIFGLRAWVLEILGFKPQMEEFGMNKRWVVPSVSGKLCGDGLYT